MKQFGLIGYPLSHSFSKKYFSEKFTKEEIKGCSYELYELSSLAGFRQWMEGVKNLNGLNVTIPYKQEVIPFLDRLDDKAKAIGAVNVIKKENDGTFTGYNSDYHGFKRSLEQFLGDAKPSRALVLGTGGASKAVVVALQDLNIVPQYVSRTAGHGVIAYDELTPAILSTHALIINTSPVGMYPHVDQCPAIPYEQLGSGHYLYDLVYNPAETLFMKKGLERGVKAKNGLDMLVLQAEKAWEIWNS
ncbi:MAG TPA: shikimate dehydrogenase [Cytophagaceae bacterium]|jgi:shikimate dehydrogenase|nr:shikimate dehydrogenase [Cytophagaceae bacterium]